MHINGLWLRSVQFCGVIKVRRPFLGFLAAIGLVVPIVMSPGLAIGQLGPPFEVKLEGFANNDCRGDLESSFHTGDGATGDNGGGNNNDRGREFNPDLIAGNNNPHLIFGNNNGACVTFE